MGTTKRRVNESTQWRCPFCPPLGGRALGREAAGVPRSSSGHPSPPLPADKGVAVPELGQRGCPGTGTGQRLWPLCTWQAHWSLNCNVALCPEDPTRPPAEGDGLDRALVAWHHGCCFDTGLSAVSSEGRLSPRRCPSRQHRPGTKRRLPSTVTASGRSLLAHHGPTLCPQASEITPTHQVSQARWQPVRGRVGSQHSWI